MDNSNRCDRCNAQAYVMVSNDKLILRFCNHHFTNHEEALTKQGFAIEIDDRPILTGV